LGQACFEEQIVPRWKIAAVQMDCACADKAKNLDAIRSL
jgi:predicted amidohydrolase